MSIRVGPTQRTVKSIFKVEDVQCYPTCYLKFLFCTGKKF